MKVEGGGGKGRGGEEEEEEMPTEAVAAAAVTSRLVFLITPDPGRAEEEKLLSDVSIMTRLCTEVRIVYPTRKTSTARREDEGEVRPRLRTRLGALPAQGAGWKP